MIFKNFKVPLHLALACTNPRDRTWSQGSQEVCVNVLSFTGVSTPVRRKRIKEKFGGLKGPRGCV